MQTANKKTTELKAADYNPRHMDERKRAALARSIQEFGMIEPLVVNGHPGRENVVIGGHQRLAAAHDAGVEEVPCVIVDLPPAQEKALNVALNSIHGTFNTPKLKRLVRYVKEADPTAPFDATGFTEPEIANLAEPITMPEPDAFAKIPDADEPDDTQMTFNVSKRQKGTIRTAMEHIKGTRRPPTSDNEAENDGNILVELCKRYNELRDNGNQNSDTGRT